MVKENYKLALQSAREELEKLLKQRAKIDDRIAHLQRTVGGLAALCDETDHSKKLRLDFAGLFDFSGRVPVQPEQGMTNAIRTILAKAQFPRTAPQIRDILSRAGFKMDEYASPLAPIHNTLKRLEKQGEATRTPGGWVKRSGGSTPLDSVEESKLPSLSSLLKKK